MEKCEKKGFFYLGNLLNQDSEKETPFFYEAKNFTTHAVCVGMTGSGKTGLGISILEEAALQKIPSIIIDPKGDLNDLLLNFPDMSSQEFLPWIDPTEAERENKTPQVYAEELAQKWKKGIEASGQDLQRIQQLKDSVEMVIYTPANTSGVPLSILSSFLMPSEEFLEDTGALRDRILSLTSSLLGLLGIDPDPIKSKEQILIASIIEYEWKERRHLDIAKLIQLIQNPPFEKIGALSVDVFFPPKERLDLSIRLNNLLASPGFQAWMEGDALNIENLLYTKEKKPKLSILSIAHLSDSERMFFVTLLLNEILSWMRLQPGTSNLRALFYMDEIFGYFPPTAMPPSKTPMLTLLKQARAYGLGIILCTQNPVDLDYKGLSNCGTWFIGKLQTERDKKRVLEGLKSASNGDIDENSLSAFLSVMQKRTFLMRSIYEKEPLLFQTRWTLSYLKGPLTLSQIASLTPKREAYSKKIESSIEERVKPFVPPEIPEFFMSEGSNPSSHAIPYLIGVGKLHFVDAKNKIDSWKELFWLAPPDEEGKNVKWEEGSDHPEIKQKLEKQPPSHLLFETLPLSLSDSKTYENFEKSFFNFLYQTQTLILYQVPELKLLSKEGESEAAFKERISSLLDEMKKEKRKILEENYNEKITALNEKLSKAKGKLEQQQQKVTWQIVETVISFLKTLLGAFFGKRITKGTISDASTSLKRAGKINTISSDKERAEETIETLSSRIEEVEKELKEEIDRLEKGDILPEVQKIEVRPRKSDIQTEKIALIWMDKESLCDVFPKGR